MPGTNVIVPPDISKLIIEREQVWSEFDRGQGIAGKLRELAKRIPDCAPAELQLQFGPDSVPMVELETVYPMVQEKIDTASRLKAEVQSCYNEIEAIKKKEKTLMLALIAGGGVVLLIIVIVIIAVVSQLVS
jgi:hypothetical protein